MYFSWRRLYDVFHSHCANLLLSVRCISHNGATGLWDLETPFVTVWENEHGSTGQQLYSAFLNMLLQVLTRCRKHTCNKTVLELFLHYCLQLFCSWILQFVCGGTVGSVAVLQAGWSQAEFPMQSLEFLIDLILLATLFAWGWLSL